MTKYSTSSIKKATAYLEWQNHRSSRDEPKYHKKYCLLRNLAKKATEARQMEYWDELSLEIEKAIDQKDTGSAYAMLRRLRGGRAKIEDMPVFDSQGYLLTNSDDRLDRWREYFSGLLNVPTTIQPPVIANIYIPPIPREEEDRQNNPPTLTELEQAIGRMKCGKAAGIDGITADVLKAGGRVLAERLHLLFLDVWENEEEMEEWSTAILIRLFKNKGDKRDCGNYRGISLLPIASKVFSRVILNRVQKRLSSQVLEEQAGFQPNRSTIDHIFTLKMLLENTRDYNKPLFLCFIDIQKAYDSVNRALLWTICKHYGITDKIVRLLELLYKDSKACVRINGELSDTFDIQTGVQQGGIPSPILFNIFFDFIIRRVRERLVFLKVTGVDLSYGKDFLHSQNDDDNELQLLTLMYADDVVVTTDNATDLQLVIHVFEEVSQEFGITMSIKKTCTMPVKQMEEDTSRRMIKGKEVLLPPIDIRIRGEDIQTVDEFCYLGYHFTRDFSPGKEIEVRLAKASTAFNMLRHVVWYRKTVSTMARLRIFRACVIPVLLYGSEVWTLTNSLEQRLCTFYHRCLRTIIGTNLSDRMSNVQLLELTGQPSLVDIMRRNRLRWFGHANRMVKNDGTPSIVKKAMFSYYPGSKRPRHAGVRKRWRDTIMDDLAKCKIRNWRKQTMDRDTWRATINQHTQVRPPATNLLGIVQQVKQRAQDKRAAALLPLSPRITELIPKNQDNSYTCPNCTRLFKPQGITKHVKSCAKQWCSQNGFTNG